MDHRSVRRRFWLTCMLSLLLACPGGNCFAGTASYRSIVLGDNPIVYYEFDEVSGPTLVNSATTGSLYDGTFNKSQGISLWKCFFLPIQHLKAQGIISRGKRKAESFR